MGRRCSRVCVMTNYNCVINQYLGKHREAASCADAYLAPVAQLLLHSQEIPHGQTHGFFLVMD